MSTKKEYWYYWTFFHIDPTTKDRIDSWRIGHYSFDLYDADDLEAFIKHQETQYMSFFLTNWKRLKKKVGN